MYYFITFVNLGGGRVITEYVVNFFPRKNFLCIDFLLQRCFYDLYISYFRECRQLFKISNVFLIFFSPFESFVLAKVPFFCSYLAANTTTEQPNTSRYPFSLVFCFTKIFVYGGVYNLYTYRENPLFKTPNIIDRKKKKNDSFQNLLIFILFEGGSLIFSHIELMVVAIDIIC